MYVAFGFRSVVKLRLLEVLQLTGTEVVEADKSWGCLIMEIDKRCNINCSIRAMTVILEYFEHILTV